MYHSWLKFWNLLARHTKRPEHTYKTEMKDSLFLADRNNMR